MVGVVGLVKDLNVSIANTTLLFCPPDIIAHGLRAMSPLIPNLPKWPLAVASSQVAPPNSASMFSSALRVRVSWSA